jgi:hypothetical protein
LIITASRGAEETIVKKKIKKEAFIFSGCLPHPIIITRIGIAANSNII